MYLLISQIAHKQYMNYFCSFPFPQNWHSNFILNASVFPELAFFGVVTFCFSACPDMLLPWWCWAAQGQSLITHLPPLGNHRPGAPLPVPPAETDPRAMPNSGPGMCQESWMSAAAVLQEGTGSYLCCSPLHGINKCSLRARKSKRLNLPLYSRGYGWWSCTRRGRIWDVLKRKGMEHISLSPGKCWDQSGLGLPVISSIFQLVLSNAMERWTTPPREAWVPQLPSLHVLQPVEVRDIGLSCLEQGAAFCHLYGELDTDIKYQNTSKIPTGGKHKNFRHQSSGDSKDLHSF